MGGFIPLIGSLASVLQGQGQGNQEAALYAQQLKQRQLQEQLNQALTLGKLREMNRTEQAVGSLPKEEQNFLAVGGTVEEWKKRQERTSTANSLADQLYSKALDPNLSSEQRLQAAQLSANLRAHPEIADKITEQLKIAGIGEKPQRPFELVNKYTDAPVFYSGTGPVPANAVSPAVYSALHRPTTGQKALEAPVGTLKGLNVVTPDGQSWPDPLTPLGDALKKGGVVLSDKGKEALSLTDEADKGLEDILAAGKVILPAAEGGHSYLTPYATGLRRLAGNPAQATFDSSKRNLVRELRAIANASRVNQTELNQITGSIDNAASYPALEAAVKEAQKQLRMSRRYLVKSGQLASPITTNKTTIPPPGALTATGPGGAKIYWNGSSWVPF